jgi:FlaG/FlaF family flagellin (archaellin)
MLINKKGVSEVITVTLIIVITVIIAGLFFAWSKNSAKTKMDEISAELKEVNDKDCSNAQFYVDSCTIYSTTKTVRLTLINNSDIKLFNLNLIINGNVSGSFDEIVEAGETAYLSTDTNFTVNRGDQNSLMDIDIEDIENITLTNGTCPKEVLDISGCTIVSTFWPPTADVPSGTYYLEQEVTLSAGEGATIYYTLDGSTPTTDSNVYSSALTIPEDANTTLKAIASAEGALASDVNTWVYNITHTLAAPTADPVAGTYYGTTDVTLSAGEGADIYYSINLGTSILYTGPITFLAGSNPLLTAAAQKAGYGTSSPFSGIYKINDSNDNTIYMFNFNGAGYDVNGTIDNDANTITAELPAGTNVTTLSPTITLHRDANVSPQSGTLTDFTNPMIYKVVAGDYSRRDYNVTVTLEEKADNTVVYDAPTKILTITLNTDYDFNTIGAQIIVYDVNEVKFITTNKETTTAEMDKAKPSPYDLNYDSLAAIGFEVGTFLSYYDSGYISHFDVVDGSSNLLATIPVANITVNSK